MRINRVEQIYTKNKNLSQWCHKAKNLYNLANYHVRQNFFETGSWLRYYDLCKLLKTENAYKELPAQAARGALKFVDWAWKAFFGALKIWKKGKIKPKPKIPQYKPKDGEMTLVFTNQQCRIKDGILKFPRRIKLEEKTRLIDEIDLREVRIVPQGIGYMIEVVYSKNVPDNPKRKPERILGIDIGVRNIVTIANNIGKSPIIIKGGVAKSINQYFNKKKAKLRSIYDKQDIKTGKKIQRLYLKRKFKMKDYMHKLSRLVVNYAQEHEVDTIIIGHNNGWKQNVCLGRRNNQNFVFIPINWLIRMIQYKSEEVGILVIVSEEDYTSKCSFLDNEVVKHHGRYMGKRINRGLFKSKNGTILNADVNAGFNIIKKAIPNAFADGIEALRFVPERIKINSIGSHQTFLFSQSLHV